MADLLVATRKSTTARSRLCRTTRWRSSPAIFLINLDQVWVFAPKGEPTEDSFNAIDFDSLRLEGNKLSFGAVDDRYFFRWVTREI